MMPSSLNRKENEWMDSVITLNMNGNFSIEELLSMPASRYMALIERIPKIRKRMERR